MKTFNLLLDALVLKKFFFITNWSFLPDFLPLDLDLP